jgi:hypothetical protein
MTQADSVHSTPRITASKSNPPDQPTTRDDELGMAWWNNLTERERAEWSAIAGNTGRPKDAWEAFRRGSMDQSPPVDHARRRFLAVAAGASVASVGTLAVAAAMPAAAQQRAACAVDPIFAAIEKHRVLIGPYAAAMKARARFDDCGEDDNIPSAELMRLMDAEDSTHLPLEIAASELICVVPSTPAGIIAAIRIIQRYHRNDNEDLHMPNGRWPDMENDDDDRDWLERFLDTIAEAVEALTPRGLA